MRILSSFPTLTSKVCIITTAGSVCVTAFTEFSPERICIITVFHQFNASVVFKETVYLKMTLETKQTVGFCVYNFSDQPDNNEFYLYSKKKT